MYHQDWLMRQISMMIDLIAKIVFKKDKFSEINLLEESKTSEVYHLYERLIRLTNELRINEAEDILFESIRPSDLTYLKLAMDFYDRLNKLNEEELAKGDFSREEIDLGLKDVLNLYGMDIGL